MLNDVTQILEGFATHDSNERALSVAIHHALLIGEALTWFESKENLIYFFDTPKA